MGSLERDPTQGRPSIPRFDEPVRPTDAQTSEHLAVRATPHSTTVQKKPGESPSGEPPAER
jgi:hypothetical protein